MDIKLPTPYKYEEKVIKKFEDLNKKGENMTVEKLIRRNHETSLHEYQKKFLLFVE